MSSNLEEGTKGGQMVCCILDLLVTVAEWDNLGVRVTIILNAVIYFKIISRQSFNYQSMLNRRAVLDAKRTGWRREE